MVFSQRDLFLARKSREILSLVTCEREFGSMGAVPPLGEATVMEVCGARTA